MTADTPFITHYQIETAIARAREERAAAMRAGFLRFGQQFKRVLAGIRPRRERLPLNGLASPRT